VSKIFQAGLVVRAAKPSANVTTQRADQGEGGVRPQLKTQRILRRKRMMPKTVPLRMSRSRWRHAKFEVGDYALPFLVIIDGRQVIDPLSESEAPPRKRVKKGKQRAESPAPVPHTATPPRPANPARPGPSRGRSLSRTAPAGPSTGPVDSMKDVEFTYEQGFNMILNKLDAQEDVFGPARMNRLEQKIDEAIDELVIQGQTSEARLDRMEEKVDKLTDILKELRKLLRKDSNRQVKTHKADFGIQCVIEQRPVSVPPPTHLPLTTSVQGPSVSSSRPDSSRPVSVPPPVAVQPVDDPVPPVAMVGSLAVHNGDSHITPVVPPVVPDEAAVHVPCPAPLVPPIQADPQVRPGVTLISATPENSQESLQPVTQLLSPAAPTPLDAPPLASSLPAPLVPSSPTTRSRTASATGAMPIPVPPARPALSPNTTTEGLLAVPPVTGDNDQGSPSLRRSPRQLSLSPAPSNPDKKRKDGPGEPTGSQTKKARR